MHKIVFLTVFLTLTLPLIGSEDHCTPFQEFIQGAIKSGRPLDTAKAALLKAQAKAAGCAGDTRMPIEEKHEPDYAAHAGAFVTCLNERKQLIRGLPPYAEAPHKNTFLGCFATLDPLDPQKIEQPKNEWMGKWRSWGIYQNPSPEQPECDQQEIDEAYEDFVACRNRHSQTKLHPSPFNPSHDTIEMTQELREDLCLRRYHWMKLQARKILMTVKFSQSPTESTNNN